MAIDFVRVLRTASSERFLLRSGQVDVACVDIHYLGDGRVNATLILFDAGGIGEKDIPGLLSQIDEQLLPDVSVADDNLVFTVVVGRVLGAFSAEK
jgi:hypothetical protein